MTINPALFSSKNCHWNSPDKVMAPVRLFGEIGLDPCSNGNSKVGAKKEFLLSKGQDGLELSWKGKGLVYVNPPYGEAIQEWAAKMVFEAWRGVEIISLLPARVDTQWFQGDVLGAADSICFWKGRLRFLGAKGPAPFPSAIAYYGRQWRKFTEIFEPYGRMVRPS